jgi:murein DD-endopeptidase MepM/ murein hydrolase activator NlpD
LIRRLCAASLISLAAAGPAPQLLGAPVANACVSSPFGPRRWIGPQAPAMFHNGIDLPAPAGGAVLAAAAGQVVSVHRRGKGGLEVAIRHKTPPGAAFTGVVTTLYAHLGSVTPALAAGKTSVAAGERLGVVGRTGVTYGTHLYFEVRIDGTPVDPAPLLGVTACGK